MVQSLNSLSDHISSSGFAGDIGGKPVVISGYYGFGNLGDEAILEVLLNDLRSLVPAEDIVVLSANPMQTHSTFAVHAVDRWDAQNFFALLNNSRLLISGGGGLFQDVRSPGSAIYYGAQIVTARWLGVPVLIYAQGIGPLNTVIGKVAARSSFACATKILLRDDESVRLVRRNWLLDAERTADPVWALEQSDLPASTRAFMDSLKAEAGSNLLIGLSLRESVYMSESQLVDLANCLHEQTPPGAIFLCLPLQADQDAKVLETVAGALRAQGRDVRFLRPEPLKRPSQWLNLMSYFSVVVGMRLHALIMALKVGVPVVGINYDPKVQRLLAEFRQPILNLTKDRNSAEWSKTLRGAFIRLPELSEIARKQAESAKNVACQNFYSLARILGMQRDPRI
jgi:polysaccharide pyruvyl transferase CsaB